VAFLTLLTLASAGFPPAVAAQPTKVVVVSLDGAGAQLMNRLMATGRMPNLSAIARSGVQADYALTSYPSKTAVGHASLWTGCYGNVNGITGNEVPLLPRAAHTILENRSGFDSASLLAEPIWVTAARNGKRALVVQGTQEAPMETFGPEGRFGSGWKAPATLVDGYVGETEPDWTLDSTRSFRPAAGWVNPPQSQLKPYEFDFKVAGHPMHGLVYDDPADPVQGYDTLQIRPDKASADGAIVLKPGPCEAGKVDKFSLPVPVSLGTATTSIAFRLFDLDPDAHGILLYHTPVVLEQSNQPSFDAGLVQWAGGFMPRGAEELYAHGKFGPTLLSRGNGEAEDRLLETVRYAMIGRINRLRYAASHQDWDLLVNYVPYPDGVEHLWYGLLDQHNPAYRPDVAPRLWPYLEEVAGMVDGFLGAARGVAGNRAALAIVSDHGFDGLAWDFRPNVLLRRAGLLVLDAMGHVDLTRTQAMYSPNDGAYVVLNTLDRRGGIVRPEQVPGVIERVTAVLRRARFPHSRRRIVTGVYQAAQADPEWGIGGPAGGDLYLDLAPGVYFNPSWNGDQVLVRRSPLRSGGHIFNPLRPSMHAIFFMTGPGVAHRRLEAVRTIDVAPTLCQLMGIPAPAQATGHVIRQALQP